MSESTEEDGRWLTYDQLAEFRGIDRPSAIKLVRRHQWRKQKDNHGNLLVLVPADQQGGSSKSGHKYPDTSEYEPPENFTRTLLAFQNAIASLREQLERERQRADRAEAQAGQAEEQIASLRAELAAAEAKAHAENLEALERLGHEKGRADAAEDERAALQAQLATSTSALAAAREELAALRGAAPALATLQEQLAATEARAQRWETEAANLRITADDLAALERQIAQAEAAIAEVSKLERGRREAAEARLAMVQSPWSWWVTFWSALLQKRPG